jgi:NAD(P)-dependent dehydrogenase (short-subunit alcohol dehydrogenase family)
LLFAREGACVAITGRNAERGKSVVNRIRHEGGEAIFVRADVSAAKDCRHAVDATVKAFGGIDILFNNAGVFYPQTAVECSEREWDEQIDVNLKGTFLMSKAALPGMIVRKRGVIINNASGWGIVGGDHAVAYCASKGGVVLMTKAMAIDHGPQGIRVNCICPGRVETPFVSARLKEYPDPQKAYEEMASTQALGRMGRPDEIAAAALYLASDEAAFVTGTAFLIDGGWSAGK